MRRRCAWKRPYLSIYQQRCCFVDLQAAIAVGSYVRVRAGVEPQFGWGSVRAGDVGTVARMGDGNKCYVDFPVQKRWTASVADLETVAEADRPRLVRTPQPASCVKSRVDTVHCVR